MNQTEENFKIFSENSVVAIGWTEVNFSQFVDAEELVDEVVNAYSD